MIDKNITKATECDNSTKREKIKAIDPHIVVSGNIDNLYYSIQWYDIDKKSMQDGYGSFTLENVRQWLKDSFEVVDDDIENLINRQKAEIENLNRSKSTMLKEVFVKVGEIITEIYNKHIFGNNDLEAEEKDAIINFSDDVTYRLEKLSKEMTGDGE